MSRPQLKKTFGSLSILAVQTVVYAGIGWAVLALLFYLLFSTISPGENRPEWYLVGTYIFEQVSFLGAAILCLRNWRSSQIISRPDVWLGIGIGTSLYFIGTLFFGYWELGLHIEPDVSPGDFFYLAAYLFIGWGMILSVISRRLNLEIWQWGVVAAIAVASIALAVWISLPLPVASQSASGAASTPVLQQTSPSVLGNTSVSGKNAPGIKATQSPSSSLPKKSPAKIQTSNSTSKEQPPAWVLSLENVLEPLATPVELFYVVCDIFLLIIATILLLAFWGGRFSLSWRMIAAATFSLYIADIWFKYATKNITDYQSGFLIEIFWVFSGVLFAIGAALEYDTSSRSRRSGRKRA
ncbi:MAG: hypothetical protein NVS2B14_09380 [Chamaesiphon sp.]